MINRSAPTASPKIALTNREISVLDQIRPEKDTKAPKDLSCYILKIAKLGGYLARTNDPPPGNMVMWRGWARLNDIMLGTTITTETYG